MTQVQSREIEEEIKRSHKTWNSTPIYPPYANAIYRIVVLQIVEELEWSLGGAKEGDAGADWINRRIQAWKDTLSDG